MSDRRLLYTVVILVNGDDFPRTDAFEDRLRAALKRDGVAHEGIAVEGWRTWESVTRDAVAIAARDDLNEPEDAEECQWYVRKLTPSEVRP